MRKAFVLAVLACAAAVVASPAYADGNNKFEVKVLSSPADMVTGGDALVQVSIPRNESLSKTSVHVNGNDVTDTLELDAAARTLTGLVTGLALGANWLEVHSNDKGKDNDDDDDDDDKGKRRGKDDDDDDEDEGKGRADARLKLVNHRVTGPIFSGPQQQPFVCKTVSQGLGLPLVDNTAGIGMPVPGGWSKDCSANTIVEFLYRRTNGSFAALPAGPLPADIAQTTTLDGQTVPYIVRREKGTINRFIYTITVLAPPGSPAADPDLSLWNGRLIFSFSGGVAIGYQQGTLSGGDHLYHNGLSKGYAVVYSTGTRTNTHYNLVLGGETAIMTKERFIEAYGVPSYTVGIGASGGAIQQYIYGQNHKGVVLDAAIPVYSYPDMVTQTIHVGDCELLEHFMDVTDAANPKWATWTNRTWLEGLASSNTIPNPYRGGAPGLTECVNGWRGLTPLAMNPLFGSAGSEQALYDPAVMAAVKWTHWDDLRNVYGVDADGYGRSTWDNVGVQYGLQALREGKITPAEFLNLNANAGSWKESKEMVQEGCPFLSFLCSNPAQFDPWSRRNMRLSPDGGVTPAPRKQGDPIAIAAAYKSGHVFRGDIDIPIIDWRHYLERQLDMHNSHQSFASRQRMLDFDRDASNGVIWFTDGPAQFDQAPEAFAVMDEWMQNIREHPKRSVAENKPAGAVDRCFNADGSEIARGRGVWNGILDKRDAGECTQRFPLFSTSRIVAGGPIEGGIYKCALKSVKRALSDGTYGLWAPSEADKARLQQIFPTGVCDYSKPDAGRPGRH